MCNPLAYVSLATWVEKIECSNPNVSFLRDPGAKLFVFGIPEDMGDKKLADLFSPYGTVMYSKVGVEKETGRNRTYGMSLGFSILSLLFCVLIGYPQEAFLMLLLTN